VAKAKPAGPVAVIAVAREVEALFRVPLDDFVAARNALAARLKAAGRPEEASTVKALRKPSATAWALNQVYWFERTLFDGLAAAGQRLLDAQRDALAGRPAALAGPARARQTAVDAVVDRAAGFLAEAGSAAGPDARRRLAVSADALAARGVALTGQDPEPGRLIADLAPPGFSLLAALATAVPPPAPGAHPVATDARLEAATPVPSRTGATREDATPIGSPKRSAGEPVAPPGPAPRRAAIEGAMRAAAAAEAALARAAAALESARAEAEGARARRRTAAEACEAARAVREEAQQRFERAQAALGAAERAFEDAAAAEEPAERAAREAAHAREHAAAALSAARARLDRLWSEGA
jgi:hypothetical protein